MHKRIGILGGMSPESTVEYYQYITRAYTKRFGDYGYPEIIIYSVSFQPYVDWPEQERWDLVAQGLSEAAQKLEAAGEEILVSDTLRGLVAGKGFLFFDRGDVALRGFEDPVRLYEVSWASD